MAEHIGVSVEGTGSQLAHSYLYARARLGSFAILLRRECFTQFADVVLPPILNDGNEPVNETASAMHRLLERAKDSARGVTQNGRERVRAGVDDDGAEGDKDATTTDLEISSFWCFS